jgi:hypothetical protein
MPWIQKTDLTPAHYRVPSWLYIPSSTQVDAAKQLRKEATQHREYALEQQKAAAKEKNFEIAKHFSLVAAEVLKEYRGYDLAIRWIEGDTTMQEHVSEPIAVYVDRAFSNIDLVE